VILIFSPHVRPDGAEVASAVRHLSAVDGVTAQVHSVRGATRSLTEIYLIGRTDVLSPEHLERLPGVERVVRISEKYRLLGRHRGADANGVAFDGSTCHVFPGLCAVDDRAHVARTMSMLERHGVVTTRMGAYKPRTSPYDFQGHGQACLPYVFELAGRHGVRVVAMEVLHESHIDEILRALDDAGKPTAVMLQIGTRNAQNFELLKHVGQQRELPVLVKRGMGITLEESLNACEYVASGGNRDIVFCLRGVKSHLGEPHRNLVDFAHVPVVKRLTRMPVCIDPSHSVGRKDRAPDGLSEIAHATAQGIIAGADMVLVDVHPAPDKALCDGPQALLLDELPAFLDDVRAVREAYEKRCAIARAVARSTPSGRAFTEWFASTR
jgi:3-deoxy-7-phosphoheptulonate synthase